MLQFFLGGGSVCLVIVYLNSLSKILVCGADDIIFILDLCICLFVLLDLLSLLLGWFCCFGGLYFIVSVLVYFIDWNIITLNGRSVIMTVLC